MDSTKHPSAKHSGTRPPSVWALGDYPRVAREVLQPLGTRLVQACGIGPGQRVLDVAAGSGVVSIPAALTGASVVASDLTPELLEAGRREAESAGAEVEWAEADAEALPWANGEFDVVVSSIGAMFVPDHQQTADELVRVCRPGGTLGLIAWTPEGTIGDFFRVFAPYLPPLEEGASPPTAWGDPDHVRALLGDRVRAFSAQRHTLGVDHFATPDAFCDYYAAHFGPTIAAYALAGDRADQLDREFRAYAAAADTSAEGEPSHFDYDYLLVTAVRA